jgi:hypothetical protein
MYSVYLLQKGSLYIIACIVYGVHRKYKIQEEKSIKFSSNHFYTHCETRAEKSHPHFCVCECVTCAQQLERMQENICLCFNLSTSADARLGIIFALERVSFCRKIMFKKQQVR